MIFQLSVISKNVPSGFYLLSESRPFISRIREYRTDSHPLPGHHPSPSPPRRGVRGVKCYPLQKGS